MTLCTNSTSVTSVMKGQVFVDKYVLKDIDDIGENLTPKVRGFGLFWCNTPG